MSEQERTEQEQEFIKAFNGLQGNSRALIAGLLYVFSKSYEHEAIKTLTDGMQRSLDNKGITEQRLAAWVSTIIEEIERVERKAANKKKRAI